MSISFRRHYGGVCKFHRTTTEQCYQWVRQNNATSTLHRTMLPVVTAEQCYQWVPVDAGSGNVSGTRMISIDDPTRILYRMQKVGDDVVCQYNRRFWPDAGLAVVRYGLCLLGRYRRYHNCFSWFSFSIVFSVFYYHGMQFSVYPYTNVYLGFPSKATR